MILERIGFGGLDFRIDALRRQHLTRHPIICDSPFVHVALVAVAYAGEYAIGCAFRGTRCAIDWARELSAGLLRMTSFAGGRRGKLSTIGNAFSYPCCGLLLSPDRETASWIPIDACCEIGVGTEARAEAVLGGIRSGHIGRLPAGIFHNNAIAPR